MLTRTSFEKRMASEPVILMMVETENDLVLNDKQDE